MADYGILTPVFKGDKDLSPNNFTPEEKTFAAEITRLISDEELYRKYKCIAPKRADDFGMETYVKSFETLKDKSKL